MTTLQKISAFALGPRFLIIGTTESICGQILHQAERSAVFFPINNVDGGPDEKHLADESQRIDFWGRLPTGAAPTQQVPA